VKLLNHEVFISLRLSAENELQGSRSTWFLSMNRMPAQGGIFFVVVAPPRLDAGLRRYERMFVPNRAGMSLHIDFRRRRE